MNERNVYKLPLAFNVCGQMLREIKDTPPAWSMAHVIMNPGAVSLLHVHERMDEAYIITRGIGKLACGMGTMLVQAGSVAFIDRCQPHRLENIGVGALEHLVLAYPPFDPDDVHVLKNQAGYRDPGTFYNLPSLQECFDGAKIMACSLPAEIDTSMAFGWVINDPERRKKPHYHEKTTECIFIVEGMGAIEIEGEIMEVAAGDWVRIEPGKAHTLRNLNDRYMVALCICTPAFDMADVHYH